MHGEKRSFISGLRKQTNRAAYDDFLARSLIDQPVPRSDCATQDYVAVKLKTRAGLGPNSEKKTMQSPARQRKEFKKRIQINTKPR